MISGITKISKWKKLTNEITETWIREYFDIEQQEEISFNWIADDVGSIFNFADYFIDFNSILKCYELKITKKQFFDWYYYCLTDEKLNISLAKFVLSPEEKAKKEKEYLKSLKDKVKLAKEELKKALETHGDNTLD